jgi:hypothetical protein
VRREESEKDKAAASGVSEGELQKTNQTAREKFDRRRVRSSAYEEENSSTQHSPFTRELFAQPLSLQALSPALSLSLSFSPPMGDGQPGGSGAVAAAAVEAPPAAAAEAIAKNAEDPLVSAAAAFKEGDDAYEVRSFFSFSLVFPRDGVS